MFTHGITVILGSTRLLTLFRCSCDIELRCDVFSPLRLSVWLQRRRPGSPRTCPMWREQRRTAWSWSARSPNPALMLPGTKETRSCRRAAAMSTSWTGRGGSSLSRTWRWPTQESITAGWVPASKPPEISRLVVRKEKTHVWWWFSFCVAEALSSEASNDKDKCNNKCNNKDRVVDSDWTYLKISGSFVVQCSGAKSIRALQVIIVYILLLDLLSGLLLWTSWSLDKLYRPRQEWSIVALLCIWLNTSQFMRMLHFSTKIMKPDFILEMNLNQRSLISTWNPLTSDLSRCFLCFRTGCRVHLQASQPGGGGGREGGVHLLRLQGNLRSQMAERRQGAGGGRQIPDGQRRQETNSGHQELRAQRRGRIRGDDRTDQSQRRPHCAR